jgi:hypothetical protein
MFMDSLHFMMILMLLLANYCEMSFVITLSQVATMYCDIEQPFDFTIYFKRIIA